MSEISVQEPITNLRDYEHQARVTLVRAGMLFVGISSFVSAGTLILSHWGSVPDLIHGGSVALGGAISLGSLYLLTRAQKPTDYSNVALLALVLSIFVPNLIGYYVRPMADHERTMILVGVLFGATCIANWRFFLTVYGLTLATWYVMSLRIGRTIEPVDGFYLYFLVPVFGLIGGQTMFAHLRRLFELHKSLEDRANELAHAKQMLIAEKKRREMEESKRRESEQIIERQAEQLRHVSRTSTMGEMVASIAHEINQPLNAMGMCSGLLLLDDVAKEDRHAAARQINELVKRCGAIISRLRHCVRRDTTNDSNVCMRQVIKDSIALVDGAAKREHVRVVLDCDVPQHECAKVLANEVELQQVVVNLLQNAIESMSILGATQPIQVSLTLRSSYVVVSVRDWGIGLRPEVMANMFEPFETSKASGMGMGLAISRSILERYRGTISAKNNDDVGATFSFKLPAVDTDEPAEPTETSQQSVECEA